MYSSRGAYSNKNKKLTGSFYTPDEIVNLMIEEIKKTCDWISWDNITILDPSCGDGQFIVGVINNIANNKTQINIEGWDIDANAIEETRKRVNDLITSKDIKINLSLHVRDSIVYYLENRSNIKKYKLIIGNPPYVRIQNISDDYRQLLRTNFNLCQSGSTDIYVAFLEMSISLLDDNGCLAFIVPNSFLYAEYAKKLRDYIKKEGILLRIIDFDDERIFKDATTYVCIVILTKKKHNYWVYERRGSYKMYIQIPTNMFPNEFVRTKNNSNTITLGKIAKIGVGLTTLADSIFIMKKIKNIKEEEKYIFLVNKNKELVKIEKEMVKPVIKGSTFKGDYGHPYEYIIFPYHISDDNCSLIEEHIIKENYPLAYSYLLKNKDILLKRDKGKIRKEHWYAYGRNQNIREVFGRKIIFPPISKKPSFILSNLEECGLYSGYFIKYDGDYEWLLSILNSEEMERYIILNSRPFRNGYRMYNKIIIENYPILK